MLRGMLLLYYGAAIAMRDLPVPPALRQDHMTAGDEGRDHARTPMQWDETPSGGQAPEALPAADVLAASRPGTRP